MDVLIETGRLYIRPFFLSDADGMYAMDPDPEVHKYLGNKPLTHIDQSRDMICFVMRQYEEYGIGRWAVIEKESNEFAGWTGHKYMPGPVNSYTDYYDFGYRLARKFWGKGYATEAGKASLRYGIDILKFEKIYAMTDVYNMASRHVLEKLVFDYIETFKYDAEPLWRKELGEPTTWYKYRHNKIGHP